MISVFLFAGECFGQQTKVLNDPTLIKGPKTVLKLVLLPNPLLDSLVSKQSISVGITDFIRKPGIVPADFIDYGHFYLAEGQSSAFFIVPRNDTFSLSLDVLVKSLTYCGNQYGKIIMRYGGQRLFVPGADTFTYKVMVPEICEYDSSISNNICPKCKRSDKACVYIWGDRIYDPEKPSCTDEYYNPDYIGEYRNCNPNWYCLRDRLAY